MKIREIINQIQPLSMGEALEFLSEKAKLGKIFLVTINPEIVMLMKSDSNYEKVVLSADLKLADGAGVIWAGKMFGKKFKGRVHGSDLVEKLCAQSETRGYSIGFLGGRDGVAEVTADRLKKKYPKLKIVFAAANPDDVSSIRYQESSNDDSMRNTKYLIHNTKIDILFVAFGSPKQEEWIHENLSKLNSHVIVGVGGTFDFISGKVRRAPKWMRSLGLEWLFRLIIQPWRIKRQLKLVRFVAIVLKERIVG